MTTEQLKKMYAVQNMGGVPSHLNGSIGTTATFIRLDQYYPNIRVQSSHATQNILVSFDGSNYFTIYAKTSILLETSVRDFYIKGSGASTTYEILYW